MTTTDTLPFGEEIAYRGGMLHCDFVNLNDIADQVGTPVYVYSASVMERRYRALEAALAPVQGKILYAVKANSNQAVISTFARLGAGADIVSEGELRRALAAGVSPEHIVFSGVGKKAEELAFALDHRIGQVNVESEYELDILSELATARGLDIRIALRINPDVDARTHPKITTGKAENKFGINIDQAAALYARAAALPGLNPCGVAVHIGSQMLDLAPFETAFRRIAGLVEELRGQGIATTHLDLGGGIGVPYQGEAPADLTEYAAIVARTVGRLDCHLAFEPGRFLVAEAGLLLTRVVTLKSGLSRTIVIQDGAMNDLIRPTLYEAYHPVQTVRQSQSLEQHVVDIVGPICESGDYLGKELTLPPVAAGDLLSIGFAGAYGASMSSTYNTRPLIAEVLIRGDDWTVIRPRQTYDTLIGQDRVPAWIDSKDT